MRQAALLHWSPECRLSIGYGLVKVLFLSEYFPRSEEGDITGGTEAVAYYMSRHLRTQHEVVVLHGPGKGVAWSDASLRSLPNRIRFVLSATIRGSRLRPDVVIGTTFVGYAAAWFVGVFSRARVVFWYNDVLIGRWTKGGFGRIAGLIGEAIERTLLHLPWVHYVAISEITRKRLIEHGINPRRIDVVHCGVEPALISQVKRVQPNHPVIVVVGRLVPYKNVNVVVTALREVLTIFPECELKIIGQGPELDNLEVLAECLGVSERVNFVGFVPSHGDVLAEIASSSVLVSASGVEGFGIILVEAMALGVPLVVSDIPASLEVTGGSAAIITPLGDSKALAQALISLLENEETTTTLTNKGFERVKAFEWPHLAAQTADLLESLSQLSTK